MTKSPKPKIAKYTFLSISLFLCFEIAFSCLPLHQLHTPAFADPQVQSGQYSGQDAHEQHGDMQDGSASDEEPAKEDPSTEGLPGCDLRYPDRSDYIAEHADTDKVDVVDRKQNESLIDRFLSFIGLQDSDALKDSGHTLYLKYTLFDEDRISDDETLDSVYARANWNEILFAQYNICTDLLDPGDGCDYFVALVDSTALNGAGHIKDHVFAELSNEGIVRDEPYLDRESGIGYVPKSMYFAEDGRTEIAYALQCQLMIATTPADPAQTYIDIAVDNSVNGVTVCSNGSYPHGALDLTTKIPLVQNGSGGIDLSQIEVFINGSPDPLTLIENQNASYSKDTGALELFFSPINLLSIEIRISPKSIFSGFADKAYAASSESLAYVPEIEFDELDLDSLHVGQSFSFTTTVGYWWPNPASGDYTWQACVNSGKYCYSWINDPDSLYEYVAWNEGANWSGVSSKELSSFTVNADSTQASRNYFNYMVYFTGDVKGGQSWHSDRWPVFCSWDPGWGGTHFGLQCSHAKNPVGSFNDAEHTGEITCRILDINLDDGKPYIVMSFVGPAIANQPGVGIYKFAVKAKGKARIGKTSSIPDTTNNNAQYSLDKIRYDVYSNPDCSGYITSILLNENGEGESVGLTKGTYYIKENALSTRNSGYAYDANVYSAQIVPGEVTEIALSDTPQSAVFDMVIEKHDCDLATNCAQGGATLEDAQFEMRYYDCQFSDIETGSAYDPKRRWILRTDSAGRIELNEDHLVGGDAFYRNSSGEICIPLGTLVIQEIKAPPGYLLNEDNVFIKNIVSSASDETMTSLPFEYATDNVIRGGVEIEKRDIETRSTKALGCADLDNIRFAIINKSPQKVVVGGIEYGTSDIVATIYTENGIAKTQNDLLPFGSYAIKEIESNEGYLLTDREEHPFQITSQGDMVTFANENMAYNQIKRGDISFVKVKASDQTRLANIPFKITSKTTGESHIVLTDKNGEARTDSSWIKHTQNTNRNDMALDDTGHLDESKLDNGSGIWFGLTQDGWLTSPDDSLGALPYDTYRIEELPCGANDRLKLVTLDDIIVCRDSMQIDLGTINNFPLEKPGISTFAQNETGSSKSIYADKDMLIKDEVTYVGLSSDRTYRLIGTLYLASTNEPLLDADGHAIESSLEFAPPNHSGKQTLTFSLDATNLFGERIVCFEKLIDLSTNEVVAAHEDISSADQTITVELPEIGTYATNADTGSKTFLKGADAKITDTVYYNNIAPNKTYTIFGKAMRIDTGDDGALSATEILDADNSPITCAATLVSESPSGQTTVTFEIDKSLVGDLDKIVIFESLESDGIQIASHTDPTNKAQTLELGEPILKTQAYDAKDGDDYALLSPATKIIDNVSYMNLTSGKDYLLKGRLVAVEVDENGEVETIEDVTDKDGAPCVTQMDLAPGSCDGIQEVEFEFDSTNYLNRRIVCYEELYDGDTLIAAHADPLSDEQTVFLYSPDIHATEPLTRLPQTSDKGNLPLFVLFSAIGLASVAGYLSFRKFLAHSREHLSTSKS